MITDKQQVGDQLDETSTKYQEALLKNPGPEKYTEAVQILKDGLDKALKTQEQDFQQLFEQWKNMDYKKMFDDVKNTIAN